MKAFAQKIVLMLVVLGITFGVYNLLWKPSVELDIRSNVDDYILVFHDNGLENAYSFDDSHMSERKELAAGRDTIKTTVTERGLSKLRIDFGETPAIVAVYSVELNVSPLKSCVIRGDDLLEAFPQMNDIGEYWLEDGAIVYNVTGADGHIASIDKISASCVTKIEDHTFSIVSIALILTLAVILYEKKESYLPKLKKVCVSTMVRICSFLRYPDKFWKRIVAIISCLAAAWIIAYIFDTVLLKLCYQCADWLGLSTICRFLGPIQNFDIDRVRFFFYLSIVPVFGIWLGKEKAIRYRYVLAIILLVLMTVGQYTGSSLGYYDNMLLGNTENYKSSTLLGIPQGLRGDEWATEKTWYFAQVNGTDEAPYYNNDLMLDGEDMVVSAFAPVKDPIIILRPELIGFLFLPADYAFAFYWWFRLIACFMAAYELIRILSGRDRYAVIGAMIFIFAPTVRWWLSQHLLDIYTYGFFAVVCFYQYFRQKSQGKRVLALLGVFYSLGCYIMAMYPAAQVPVAYVLLAIVIWILCQNWQQKPFSVRNIVNYLIALLPVAILLIRFAFMSLPAIEDMLNTTFPGSDRIWIKLPRDYALYQLVNPFTALIQHPSFSNACEISQFYTFEAILIPLVAYMTCKYGKKCLLPALLCGITTLLYAVAWLPEIPLFNKLTLLSMSYPVRILIACGVGFTLTLMSLLPLLEEELQGIEKKPARILAGTAGVLLLLFVAASKNVNGYFQTAPYGYALLLIVVELFSYMSYLLLSGGKKACNRFLLLMLALNVVSTMGIDPITMGTDSMFEKTTMREIREINAEKPGRWMVSGNSTIANLVTAQGVARTSGTYYYPDWAMFEIIDPDHLYIDLWKQFAHIDMRLTSGNNVVTDFDLERGIQLDGTSRCVYIDLETAAELDIRYVFTCIPVPEEMVTAGILQLRYRDTVDPWMIYEICQ